MEKVLLHYKLDGEPKILTSQTIYENEENIYKW